MINFFTAENGMLQSCSEPSPGCWISVVAPSSHEIKELIEVYGLDSGFVKSSPHHRMERLSCGHSVAVHRPQQHRMACVHVF